MELILYLYSCPASHIRAKLSTNAAPRDQLHSQIVGAAPTNHTWITRRQSSPCFKRVFRVLGVWRAFAYPYEHVLVRIHVGSYPLYFS